MINVTNSAQLRHGITTGQSGDKVANIDPAAAPLGTDDEAAGMPPSKEEVRLAARHELKGQPTSNPRFDGAAIVLLCGATALLALGAWIGMVWIVDL